MRKYFPKENKLSKLINKNTVKISYSCLPNLDCIIKRSNKAKYESKIGRNNENTENKNCNKKGICKNGCIINGKCETECAVYKASVHVNDHIKNQKYLKKYVGMTDNKLSDRIGHHYTDFK